MPQLKKLSCTVQWANTGVSFQEYGTVYGDGLVESFIVVPNKPQPFTIQLKSLDFIYDGLAVVVFVDGKYQANRNRVNLKPYKSNAPLNQTNIDFLFRQREKPIGDGVYMGRQWRFDNHNIVEDLPDGVKQSHFDQLGTIEVLVLRCRATIAEEANQSGSSSAADSDALGEKVKPVEDSEKGKQHKKKPSDKDGVDDEPRSAIHKQQPHRVNDVLRSHHLYGLDGATGGYSANHGPPPWNSYNNHHNKNDPHFQVPVATNGQIQPSQRAHAQSSASQGSRPSSAHKQVRFDLGPQPPGQSAAAPPRPPSYERIRQSNDVPPNYGWPIFPMVPHPPPQPYPPLPCHLPKPSDGHRVQPEHAVQHRDSGGLSHYQGYSHPLPPVHPMVAYPCIPPMSRPFHPNRQEYVYPDYHHYPQSCPPGSCHHQISSPPPAGPPAPPPPPPPPPPATHPHIVYYPYPLPTQFGPAHSHQYSTSNQPDSKNTGGTPSVAPSTGWDKWGANSNNTSKNSTTTPIQSENQAWLNGQATDSNNTTASTWTVYTDNDTTSQQNSASQNDSANQQPSVDNNANNISTWRNSNDDWNNIEPNNDSSNNNGNDDDGGWGPYDSTNAVKTNNSGIRTMDQETARALFGPHGQYYTYNPKGPDEPLPDAEEEPRYDVPRKVADASKSTKQVLPGSGYMYWKKRRVPQYIDTFEEPYARFVFKYRTKENEIGIKLDIEPTGDEAIQELQGLDRQALIEMVMRASSALGGKIPSPPLKPIGAADSNATPVPVDPPDHTFLNYKLPELRQKLADVAKSNNSSVGNDWNSGSKDDWNTDVNNNDSSGIKTSDWDDKPPSHITPQYNWKQSCDGAGEQKTKNTMNNNAPKIDWTQSEQQRHGTLGAQQLQPAWNAPNTPNESKSSSGNSVSSNRPLDVSLCSTGPDAGWDRARGSSSVASSPSTLPIDEPFCTSVPPIPPHPGPPPPGYNGQLYGGGYVHSLGSGYVPGAYPNPQHGVGGQW